MIHSTGQVTRQDRVATLRMGLLACALFVSASLAGCGMSSSNSAGKIVFMSNRDGNYEVYSMDSDGTNQVNLSNNPAPDLNPVWSPDGTEIAFLSVRNGDLDLFVMAADGTSQHRVVTIGPAIGWDPYPLWPKWSPDGTALVFYPVTDRYPDIWMVKSDGTNLRNITNSSGWESAPSWIPDGSGIVYTFRETEPADLDVVQLSLVDSTTVNLTRNTSRDSFGPQYSPDGSRILFLDVDQYGPGRGPKIITPDGRVVTYIDLGVALGVDQIEGWIWSPDGSLIAIGSYDDLMVLSADGSDLKLLTEGRGDNRSDGPIITKISWSPDGEQLVFDIGLTIGNARWLNPQIHSINVDGTDFRQLTTEGENLFPDWSPVLPNGRIPADIPPVLVPTATAPATTALDTPAAPTATLETSTAWLSGVAYPYATDCTDGVCPSCGQADVYAVDVATGAYYHTFVDGKPCRYSIEVPAPGTYTVAALTRQGQVCGTYLTPAELERLGYCDRICEPSQVSVLPGDALDDLHIPLYLYPEEWPRGLTCIFIPVDTPPPPATPQQDQGSSPTCTQIGQTWMRPEDGMEMVCVPAGSFLMGSQDEVGSEDEHPQHTVNLDAYWIDRYEVTNAQYAQCVTAGACTTPDTVTSITRDAYFGNPTYDQFPVVWLRWEQAQAYCNWVDSSLPTEAQWEKAAGGGLGFTYPWGNQEPDCALANFNGVCVGDTTMVGSYPSGASPYGALDMAGNVTEKVLDGYDAGFYQISPLENPVGPEDGSDSMGRGGSFYRPWTQLRAANRGVMFGGRQPDVGFRCARQAP